MKDIQTNTYYEKNKVDEKAIYDAVTSDKRTYEQKVLDLAHLAENQLMFYHLMKRQFIILKQVLSMIYLKDMLHIDADMSCLIIIDTLKMVLSF